MATQFAPAFKSSAPVPFLLGKRVAARGGDNFAEAMQIAIAAQHAQSAGRKSSQRIALFLCELGKAHGCRTDLPLSRAAIAAALGISLVRVKRALALFSLSGLLSCNGEEIRIVDWRKLGGVAHFDASDLDLAADEDEDLVCPALAEAENIRFMTASGEPACFV